MFSAGCITFILSLLAPDYNEMCPTDTTFAGNNTGIFLNIFPFSLLFSSFSWQCGFPGGDVQGRLHLASHQPRGGNHRYGHCDPVQVIPAHTNQFNLIQIISIKRTPSEAVHYLKMTFFYPEDPMPTPLGCIIWPAESRSISQSPSLSQTFLGHVSSSEDDDDVSERIPKP